MADDVYRRVVVEYGLQYVYLYLADQNGKVIGEEVFKQPVRLDRSDAAGEAKDTFDFVYDMLNDTINFPGTAGD